MIVSSEIKHQISVNKSTEIANPLARQQWLHLMDIKRRIAWSQSTMKLSDLHLKRTAHEKTSEFKINVGVYKSTK